MSNRQIVLDTETTGLDPTKGHRIIEIGCVELIDRKLTGNHFHYYFNPDREIDAGAMAVHGISTQFLSDKPRFHEKADDMFAYLQDAELIIHNATFDLNFLQHELQLTNKNYPMLGETYTVIDTLMMARQLHPGQKNNLDALCKRYHIDNAQRNLHGALLDAEILAQVYLAMTGGQTSLFAKEGQENKSFSRKETITVVPTKTYELRVIQSNEEELQAHLAMLNNITKATNEKSLWEQLTDEN